MVHSPGARLVLGRITSVANASFKLPKLTRALEEFYAPKNEEVANDDLDTFANRIFDQVIFVGVRILIPSIEG